jgi:hypothetical protein
LVVSKSQNSRVPERKQPYAIRVHGPARNVPTPCPATGVRESAGADTFPFAPFVCVKLFTALAGVTLERGVDDKTFETGADDITPETGADDMTLETGVDDRTLETGFAGVRTVWDDAGVTAVAADCACGIAVVVVVAVFATGAAVVVVDVGVAAFVAGTALVVFAAGGGAVTFFAGAVFFAGTVVVVCAPAAKQNERVIATVIRAITTRGCLRLKRLIGYSFLRC